MRFRMSYFILLGMLLIVVAATAACGFGSSPATATAPRRTRAPAATVNAANPTPDALDDSQDDTQVATPDPSQPTPDGLNDSPNSGEDNGGAEPTAASASAEQPIALMLPGSAWLNEEVDQIYRFCEDGSWEIVQGGDTVQGNGTFTADGESLVMNNASNNQATTYALTWHDTTEILELNDGTANLILHYDGDTDCP